ncbi:hybrid sensor histidine kinase/response regulator transcription factor [Pedobacter insulae]|uniref:histidine kinase n=1 Tax=Pedobacter insulae TaxID=414048 RepID=A0A1I2VRY2_9SPHI|nr:hybrid sensor histidine kinase/response regulator transcription factor [Pedobacter insulae]SFG91988.1 Signal transduction histidine kinase [Pedobacter insulae]
MKYWLLLISVLFLNRIYAQKPIVFNHLSMENGLSQNSVMAITQDKNQFLWFGTRGGLNRYDGYRFKVYTNNENPYSISDNSIVSLLTTSSGLIMVGTENGLNFYDEETDRFTRAFKDTSSSSLSSNLVECLYEDPKKNLWVGTLDGLNLLVDQKKKKFKRFFFDKPGGPSRRNMILAIFKDAQQNIWLGTEGGLIRMYAIKGTYHYELFKHNPQDLRSISSNYVRSITCDKNKNLWVGTDKGLNLFNYKNKSFSRFQKDLSKSNSLINNDIRKIIFDKAGKLWIATQEGISIFDPLHQTFSNHRHHPDLPGSLSQNSTHSIFQDISGSMYIGTYYKGVNVVYPYSTNFTVYKNSKSQASISSNIISAMVEDQYHNLWIGTEGGGLNYLNRRENTFSHYFANPNNPYALTTNLIKTLYLDKAGKLMIGTHRGGLFVFDAVKQRFKKIINVKEEYPYVGTAEIVAITEDSEGTVWVGSKNGLSTILESNGEYLNTTVKSPVEKKLSNKFIQVLFEDKSKNLWIGTMGGLFTYFPLTGNVRAYYKAADSNSLQSNRINCIIQTKNGHICVGTYLGGLSIFNTKTGKFTNFSERNGLPNNNILGIIEDQNENLWLSTDKGLSKMEVATGKFYNYTRSDGIAGNDFNFRSFFKDSKGQLFFGGYDGVTSFKSDQIEVNNRVAPITFTGLKLFNEPVLVNGPDGLLKQDIKTTKKLVFEHNNNNFSIEFALLNYVKPEKNNYAYKLLGYNENWVHTNIPNATYANLQPGNYTFIVKGINNDGVDGGSPATIEIKILPPFWATWWAYLLYILLFGWILFLIIRYIFVQERLKRTEDLQRMKLNFFTYIAHEIRTPLTLIIGPLESLLNTSHKNPELHKQLVPIKHNADRLIRLITELMDFRKAETHHLKLHVSEDNIIDFINEIFLSFKHIAQDKHITYTFIHELAEIKLYYDKLQLEKVLYNLLSNAFKFTQHNGHITVTATVQEEDVVISIQDTGRGIPIESQPKLFSDYFQVDDQDTSQIGSGIGLALSKIIVEAHHGEINFVSNPSEGNEPGYTNFSIRLKRGKSHYKQEEFENVKEHRQLAHTYAYAHDEVKLDELVKEAKQPAKETILLVEDNAEIMQFISKLISKHYQVLESADGLEGWETAIKVLPDLIICDVMMPKIDGLELCRRLKADERTSHIPIIILTARSSHIHHIDGLETGADIYVTKPFSPDLLLLSVRNLLMSRMAVRQRYLKYSNLEPKDVTLNSVDEVFMSKLLGFINEHIADENFGVDALASKIGMSRPVLYKKVRMLTDLSVNDFVKSIRLKKAKQLFMQNRYTIYEVSYQVGFNDPKYFSREFKKQFGESPRSVMDRSAE